LLTFTADGSQPGIYGADLLAVAYRPFPPAHDDICEDLIGRVATLAPGATEVKRLRVGEV
jgi:hypothetical protein